LGTKDSDVVAIVFHNELDEDVALVQVIHENNDVENGTEKGNLKKGYLVVLIERSGNEFEVTSLMGVS
jgi:hypothetical protein